MTVFQQNDDGRKQNCHSYLYDAYQRLGNKADSRYFVRKQENNWVMPGWEEGMGRRKKSNDMGFCVFW